MYNYDIRSDLPILYDFYIVAKEGNYSKTAEKYFVSQPNLSRSVKSLESKMNVVLFVKVKGGVKLTNDGEKLYNELDSVFSNPLFKKNDEYSGTVTIGTTRNIADYKLEKYLSESFNKYPNIKIKVITDSATNLNNYLFDHKIDILIDYLPHINTSEKYELEIVSIDSFSTCFACSKELYNKIGNNIKSLKDLNKYNLVIQGSSRRKQYLDELLQSKNIKLTPKMEMPDSKLMIDFVEKNEFIGYFIEDELKNTNLVKIDLEEKMPFNAIGIIYHKKTTSNVARKFVELVVNK